MSRGNRRLDAHDLTRLALRYAEGEDIESLADECGVDESILRERFKDFSPLEAKRPLLALDRAHQDEIVQRYKFGEPITHIIKYLRELGLPANWYWVETVLDHHGIIRHSKSGEIPKGAPEGFSLPGAQPSRDTPIVGSVEEVRLPNLDELSGDLVRLYRDEGEKIESILFYLKRMHGISASAYKVKRILRDQGVVLRSAEAEQATRPEPSGEGSSDGLQFLSKRQLKALAERHAEGGGEPIRILAAREGVDEADLRRALQEAGYVVSTYTEWLRRTQGD
jgi:hypothetical protein